MCRRRFPGRLPGRIPMAKSSIPASHLRLKRAYEPASPDDGMRILIDRLWPRGVTKAQARHDERMKDIARGTGLRQWFGHDPKRRTEFRQPDPAELKEHAGELGRLREPARKPAVPLVY